MKNKIGLLVAGFLLALSVQSQNVKELPQIYQTDGIYYRDRAQTELYTGDYRELHDNGTIRLEMQIKNDQNVIYVPADKMPVDDDYLVTIEIEGD